MPRQPEQVDRELEAALAQAANQAAAQVRAHHRDLVRSPASLRRRRALRWTWRTGKTLARKSYRRRRPLAPFLAGLLLYATGFMFSRSPHGASTVPLFALPFGLWLWWRGRRHDWRASEWRYAWAVYAGALGWLEAAAAVGVGAPMPGVFLLAWIVAAGPWWWHHRIRPQLPDYDDRVEIWDTLVAAHGCALPGSELFDVDEVETGWTATIALPAGRLTTSSALSAASRIASAYGVPSSSVVVEAPLTGEEHRARLLVLTENPLQQVQPFPGPQLHHSTGQFPIGLHADGTVAFWRLWTPGSGACHGLVSGTTGSGKSGFVNLLCAEIRHSGVVVLWLGDPEEGTSVPDWQDSADWFAGGVPEIRRMLRAVERVMNGRKKRRAQRAWIDDRARQRKGQGHFDPTPEEPQLTVVIDESPDVMNDPECARIVALIGKKGRKLGVSVVLVAQVPSVGELGGNVTVRSMMSSTNIVMFRTSDQFSGKMGLPQDLPVDPKNLPSRWPDGSDTAGLAYIASSGGRVSPLRAMKVDDPYHWATIEMTTASLDADSASDAGEDYQTRHKRRLDGHDANEDAHSAEVSIVPVGTGPDRERTTTRAAILDLVTRHGRITTGTVAGTLTVPLSTASQTLRRLETNGLVKQVRRGIWAHIDYLDDGLDGDAVIDVA
jgi:DNA-binding transcriptional ArsR family regulator